MKTSIQIILAALILISCRQNQNQKNASSAEATFVRSTSIESEYSEEFVKYFHQSNLILKGDSIVFPKEAGSEVVLIPSYIPKNTDVRFTTVDGNSITIRQINFTDIEFSIRHDEQEFKGKASLDPLFHLGMETVEFSDGEFVVTHYHVTETENSCLEVISLGNQNIAEKIPGNVYALISVSGDACEDELGKLTNKRLKPVANNVYDS